MHHRFVHAILMSLGILLFGLSHASPLHAQSSDTLILRETLTVGPTQTLDLSRYTHVLLMPQASIWVEGTLVIQPATGRTVMIGSCFGNSPAKGSL